MASLNAVVVGAMSSSGDLLTKMSGWRGGLALIVLAFLAGGGVRDALDDYIGQAPRIAALEQWREFHDDSITNPRVRQLDALETRQDTLDLRLERIELLLACQYYDIVPCPGAPPRPLRVLP